MAKFRTSVGNSSASRAPKPAVQPEPSPMAKITVQNQAGCASSSRQWKAMP